MPSQRLVEYCYRGVALLLVAVASFFQAHGIAQLLSLKLLDAVPRPRTPTLAPSSSSPKSGEAALAHNVFDSSAKPLERSREDFTDPLAWPACQNVQAVLVTESSDPLWSLASLREPGNERARLRRVGDDAAGKQVVFIGFNPRQQAPAVWLQDAESPCQAMLFRAPPPPVVTTVVAVAPAPDLGISKRIQKLNDTTFNVERPLVESALGDTSQFLGSVRARPEIKDGKTVGLRLFGIRPESLLSSLGLRNGDRLESINGFELARPERL